MAQISLKVKDDRLAVIDRAASIRGVSRTEFLLRTSEEAAIQTLNERPLICLTEDSFAAFVEMLERPVEPNGALGDLATRTPGWDR